MLKLLGAVLLSLGGLMLGVGAVEERRRRVRALEDWRGALGAMAAELTFRLPTMEELLERAARAAAGAAEEPLAQAARGLKDLAERPFEEIWRSALAIGAPPLNREDLVLLARLGGVLGRYDAQTQRRELEETMEELTRRAETARGELARSGRAFGVAGLSLGMFTAILLL